MTEEYLKLSCFRQESLRIISSICCSQDEQKFFCKRAYSPSSAGHIQAMLRSEEELRRQFSGTKLEPNRILRHDGNSVFFEYLSDTVDLGGILIELLEAGELQKAREIIFSFAQLLRSRAHQKFYETPKFRAVFGSNYNFRNQYSLDYTDLDINFDNILLKDGKWVLIDYEFAFDFLIPVDFLVYRSVYYLFTHRKNVDLKEMEQLFFSLNLTKNLVKFRKMEQNFQKYVGGDTIRMHRLLGQIMNAGSHPIEFARGFLEKQQRT